MTFHTFNSYYFPQNQTFRILGGTDPPKSSTLESIMIADGILFLSTFGIVPLQPITLASNVEDM
jgi:hypothetical protein